MDTVYSTMEKDAEVFKSDICWPTDGLIAIQQIINDFLIQTTLIFEQHRCRRMSLGEPLLSAHLPQYTWILWLLVFVRIQT